ncbi:group 1 truncated hemoglobin [Xylophilus sp. GOD-11R]|uniref:group I truncated hemoglobin n=1 Tax=Xylophilus sp. GOD-11R TaxID=3089814 RepID=UPI00298C4D50|nr:group 1 truncated hemoglobin [Xylophilus sp. GOD-11R]WPB57145.1 group 1 truncated hemoglobin [Xylophilus sp. GOD-11R]
MKTSFIRIAAAGIAAACLAIAQPALADEALYQQFGGEEGMQRIADDMITASFANPKTAPYFAKASVKRLRVQLASHFCEQVGGPCKYTGSSMKNVHAPLHIDRAAFNALVENLQFAMDKNNVPFRAQNQLLAKLAPMHRDIENPRDAPSVVPLREALPSPDDPADAAPAPPAAPSAAPSAVSP